MFLVVILRFLPAGTASKEARDVVVPCLWFLPACREGEGSDNKGDKNGLF